MVSVLILLLLCLNFQLVYSNNDPTPDISCDQKINIKPYYHQEFYCRDFSASGRSNKSIASCALFWYGQTISRFGWNFQKNAEYNWVHPISIKEPDFLSCSMKLNLHEDIVETISEHHDKSKGKKQD